MLDAETHLQRLMRIAHIFERSGEVIGAIFTYREVIFSQDAISAPLARERVKALARSACADAEYSGIPPTEIALHHDAAR